MKTCPQVEAIFHEAVSESSKVTLLGCHMTNGKKHTTLYSETDGLAFYASSLWTALKQKYEVLKARMFF